MEALCRTYLQDPTSHVTELDEDGTMVMGMGHMVRDSPGFWDLFHNSLLGPQTHFSEEDIVNEKKLVSIIFGFLNGEKRRLSYFFSLMAPAPENDNKLRFWWLCRNHFLASISACL